MPPPSESPPPSRRQFLHTGAAVSALVVSGGLSHISTAAAMPESPEWRNRQSDMTYRQLGRTGMMVSRIVMGGNTIGPNNNDHVRLAMDMGLNYGDTAPQYTQNDSQGGYGNLFKQSSLRDRLFITTKVSDFDNNRNRVYKDIFDSLDVYEQQKMKRRAEELMEERDVLAADYFGHYGTWQVTEIEDASLSAALSEKYSDRVDRRKEYYQLMIDSVENSLQKLNTDHLDCIFCPHGANTAEELNIPEVFEAFQKLKKDGKVRFLGFSSHTDTANNLLAANRTGQYDVAQIAYNPLNAHRVAPAVATAAADGMGIIAMKVARAVMPRTGYYPDPKVIETLHQAVPGDMFIPMKAYAMILRDPNLTAVVSEMITEEHVRDNLPLAFDQAGNNSQKY